MVTTTINLTRRQTVPPLTGGFSTAPTTPAARVAAFRASGATEARHLARRARGARRAVRHAFVQVVAAVAWLGLTLITLAREFGLHVAAMGCFVAAGFAVGDALGWFVAGFAVLWTQRLAAGESPPQ